MKTSMAALAAALVVGGMGLPADPFSAQAQVLDSLRNRQRGERRTQQAQRPRIGDMSAEESEQLMPLYQAVQTQDWTAVRAALPQARQGATSPQGKFLVGQIMYQLANATQDEALAAEAVTMMIQSGGASPEQLAELQRVQSNRSWNSAVSSGNLAAIETQLEQRLAATPNDTALITQLAQVKTQLQKHDQALELYRRLIEASSAGGQRASEDVYRRATGAAYQARNAAAIELARSLVQAYPNPTNWRDALIIYREIGRPSQATELDLYRLMRAAGALTSEADYVQYAEAANRGAVFGEVKAVLDEAVGRNVITAGNTAFAREMLAAANRRIAEDRSSLANERRQALAGNDGQRVLRLGDAYYGYGQYAEAAELYRAAAQKGADANIANLRLGAALAQAGQRAEAEAALRAVSGAQQPLAQYWLLWLAGRG